ncbi:dedicator of cytokinesis protein 2 isoform X4 [Folsomia candida]|uniref:dedicator of cytokinesis protein 2 isoform X4 n=1 Tax=Folsomia candida TaxID=158441 RepID=UPI000B8FC52E|nr:dedicator of cytokinesis protein 2 isoform X4 [Folsomia candida]
MHSTWLPVQDRLCYGVAKASLNNASQIHPYVLGIHLGEAVIVKGECDEWFYVKKFDGEGEGIVPKSYIHIKECSVIRNGETEIVVPKQPTLSQEIVASLQEWYKIAKLIYVNSSVRSEGQQSAKDVKDELTEGQKKFMIIREKILNLHECRKRLLSSNPTVEGLKELKQQVASIIDSGNSLLKLDMVVRDEYGNPLDPLSTSTVQLFRQHQRSSQKLKKNLRGSNRGSKIITHSSHSLIVTVNSINWRVVDECEIRFFLCDMQNDEPNHFTESVQITLKAGSPSKTPFKFLFTDLGKPDFERSKVFLVAYVVRVGAMDFKEDSKQRDHYISPFNDKRNNIHVKRPYGVAAKEITHLFRDPTFQNLKTTDAENEVQTLLYLPCKEEDTMDDTLKKILGTIKGEQNNGKDAKAVGFVLRLSMVAGTPRQIQDKQPILLRGNPIIARKMGFPEVILPDDTRNDLYIKLIRGEFHRTAKTTDRNVEVTVSVHNDRGVLLPGILSGGNGCAPVDSYRSVVYYHNDKPRWNEHFKISLPMNIEEFSTAHVKFTFKHRSSSESKDKSEKPFALAYLKLKEPEGTAIRDDHYELILYKIDPKHYRESEVQYLSLPYMKTPTWAGMSKPSCQGFSCSSKDYFYAKTNLCSTNFTQNADLLQLLLWVTKLRQVAEMTMTEQPDTTQEALVTLLLDNLCQILAKVTKVGGEEIVKFLHPILDALFLILVDPMEQISTELQTGGRHSIFGDLSTSASLLYRSSSAVSCEHEVFNCLLHIFCLILDHKFQNFQPLLNLYIEDNFSSTLAYQKLAKELNYSIQRHQPEKVLRVMKSIEFFFKFIIKSFEIHKRLRFIDVGQPDQDRDDDDIFEKTIDSLFKSMCGLLKRNDLNDPYIGAEGGCLKHIPSVIEDLVRVYPARKLSENLVELCCVVPQNKLTNIKLSFISEIVHSQLFIDTECRFNFLPTVTSNILVHLPGNDETEKSVELLGDVMDILHRQPEDQKVSHIWYIMQILLRPIICSIGTISTGDPLASNMIMVVTIFLSLLREMKNYHYGILINSLKAESATTPDPYKQGLLKFLNDVLVVIKNLFHPSYFMPDWNTMILLQNSIVLTALEHFASTVKAEFAEPFEEQPWNNFFVCAVSFLTQPSLQLEEFSQSKQNYIIQNFKDMRKRAADLIRVMWFSLGESKRIRFVPGMVGTFLDMSLVPEAELRRTTIPIFFDMMHCEFDQDRPVKSFKEVEDELIKKIVEGIEGGKGDVAFRDIFSDTMTELCEHNSTGLRQLGLSMVSTLTTLMDLLLQYREIEDEEDPGNRMSCIVNLLDFSKEINRKELYLRYLYKLHDLHIRSKNFTEAGFTLKLHSHQLEWSDEEVPPLLRVVNRHPNLVTQMELKEALYNDIVHYFNNAKMWECALEVCDELRQQYEDTYNYVRLPKLHRQVADFYDKILDDPRFKPEYFRVAFYGGGFPSFLQDKVFVYRGNPLQQLSDFEGRMLGQYVQAELLRNLGPPSDDIRFSNKQYLQICKVDPVMSTSKRLSGMRYADENILNYYRSNEIDKFTYSRPYYQEPKDPVNEFASLWLDRYTLWISQSFPGIMSWFPVVRDTLTKLSPLENAIETLQNANEKMRKLVIIHCTNVAQDLGEMTMKLNGILDAAVQGGVANYEKAFINQKYLEKNPMDGRLVEDLKELIFLQIPIIEECLKIHARKSQASLLPLHNRMEELFKNYIGHIESTYGISTKTLKDEGLHREMDKAFKKQEAKAKRLEPKDPRHADFIQGGHSGHRGSAIGRTMGSFATSTTSLYQNANGTSTRSVARSMATISQRSQNLFRRSAHSSFSGSMEGEQFTSGSGGVGPGSNTMNHHHTATLPRQGSSSFYTSLGSGSSSTKLPPLEADGEITPPSGGGTNEALITLTQTLVAQRPPRSHPEHRNSWTNGASSRLSEMSVSSLETLRPAHTTSEPGSRNSVNSPDSAIGGDVEAPAPPLPPKQRVGPLDPPPSGPPPPPPKKPALKAFRND